MMAYFSNGTEGMMYEEEYCSRCVHSQDSCSVMVLHNLYNYDACNPKTDVQRALHDVLETLIPSVDSGTDPPYKVPGECSMFHEAGMEVEAKRMQKENTQLRDKLQRLCDWLKFTANAEGGIVKEVEWTMRVETKTENLS